MSLHSSSSVNGEGSTPKDPLYKILDELRSLKLWKEKQERKEKGKKRVEEISQDEREKIREEERRKIMKEMKREKHASYSSHDSCKSLSEELSDYYRGRHSSHTKHHSQRREKDRRPQEVNISLPYFHGKDNVEAYLDWEMKVEQLFACHHISEERKVPLATLSFQGLNTSGLNTYSRSSLVRTLSRGSCIPTLENTPFINASNISTNSVKLQEAIKDVLMIILGIQLVSRV